MSDRVVIKSDWFNTLFPTFIRVFGITFIVSITFFLVLSTINSLGLFSVSYWIMSPILVISILILIGLIIDDVITIMCTNYIFEHGHLRYHYKFFHEESHSVQYKQITDVEVRRDIWDRICRTGTLLVHTGSDNDDKSVMRIRSVKEPDLLHDHIQHLIKSETV